MNNIYEIQLNATNKTDKRKKKENNFRKLPINLDIFKGWEGQQIFTREVYKSIDPDLFERRNGNLGGKEYLQYERLLKRFFEDIQKVKSKLGGNRYDYLFGNLFNEDGTPIPFEETRGSKVSELTFVFKALLLLVLQESTVDEKERSINKWLEYFGFINKCQKSDLDSFYYSIYENDQPKEQRNHFAQTLIDRKAIPESYPRYSKYSIDTPDEFNLTDKEILNLFKAYNKRTLQALKYRLRSSLVSLDKDSMIKLDSFMSGKEIYKKIKFNEETNEIEEEILTRFVELSKQERHKLIDIELELKAELGLDELKGHELYAHPKYKEKFNEYLIENGIKTANSCRKFEFVYEAHTIKKRFNDINLKEYLKEHEEIKKYYDKGKQILVNDYREARLNHILIAIERKKSKDEARILDDFSEKRDKKEVLGQIEENKQVYNVNAYAELAQILSTNLLTYHHYDTLAPHEIPKREDKISTSDIDFNTLPF